MNLERSFSVGSLLPSAEWAGCIIDLEPPPTVSSLEIEVTNPEAELGVSPITCIGCCIVGNLNDNHAYCDL